MYGYGVRFDDNIYLNYNAHLGTHGYNFSTYVNIYGYKLGTKDGHYVRGTIYTLDFEYRALNNFIIRCGNIRSYGVSDTYGSSSIDGLEQYYIYLPNMLSNVFVYSGSPLYMLTGRDSSDGVATFGAGNPVNIYYLGYYNQQYTYYTSYTYSVRRVYYNPLSYSHIYSGATYRTQTSAYSHIYSGGWYTYYNGRSYANWNLYS